ncbi:hypothetical protein BHE74_00016097, partial [Ensete ventricosum]
GPVTTMGCILGKFTAEVGLFPVVAPHITAASTSRPTAASVAGHRHLHRAPPPLEPEPPRRPSIILYSPAGPPAWPAWLSVAAGDALAGFPPRRANSFEKLKKIGSGTYSNVYKARDLVTKQLVALKKVRAEAGDGLQFMLREIALLRLLDHPNVIRLEGLALSRVPTSTSLYLVFDYMEHDLSGLTALPGVRFTVPQVKCYMKQLLSGLEHCHSQGVLHRDMKCSNLLLNKEGILKIADFGLATCFDPNNTKPMTSKVVTLWYRPPELLLGATQYSVGVDLWSAGCILAELLTGKPILPGQTECSIPLFSHVQHRRLTTSASVARAERFPPPHLDATIGISVDSSRADREFTTVDELFMSSNVAPQRAADVTREDGGRRDHNTVRASVIGAIRPYLMGNLTDLKRKSRAHQSRRESAVAAAAN